jgi:hypothetical protein
MNYERFAVAMMRVLHPWLVSSPVRIGVSSEFNLLSPMWTGGDTRHG